MDLRAYHNALNQGFSESEASRIGDDAWENNRQQQTCELEPEPDYYDVLVVENTRLLATISRLREYIQHKPECQTRPENPWPNGLPTCDCGYDEFMKEVEETK